MIAVVHLVWGPLGLAPLRRFLASYGTHSAGTEHELIVLFNGVTSAQRPAVLAELEDVPHRLIELAEPTQDLAAYARAAQSLEHERLCFLNSYSVILASDWLAKLEDALVQPGVGLVGASGSWTSSSSLLLYLNVNALRSPYRRCMPDRRAAIEQMQAIEASLEDVHKRPAGKPERSLRFTRLRGALVALASLPVTFEHARRFPGFPNHHLRTNGFMVARTVLAAMSSTHVVRKIDAHALESGRNSFTRQIARMGLRTLVVDRQGAFHEQEKWPASRTFWQGDQEGLLIADNQTRMYEVGDAERRRLLSAMAWGPYADPRTLASLTT